MERKFKEKPQSKTILILCLIVLFFTLILFLLLKGCNNDIKIEHIDIINLPEQIEIGTFDECNIQLNVIYSDYTTELVDVKEKDIPKEYQHYLYEEGTHSFDYLYKGYEVQFNITMYEVKYTVKFINVVDEVVKEVIVKKNEKVEYPTKEEMYVEGYRFLETYDKDITYLTSDVEIKGNYVKTWIVKFYNGLNEVISTQIVDDKSSAKSPSEEDIKMDGYTFIMWDKVYTNITSNTDIFGIYEEINVTCDHNIVDATCTNPSYCTKCNTTFGNALGHNYIINNKKDTTCKTDGYIEYKCSRNCGSTKRETILSTGHKLEIVKIPATCTEDGKVLMTCKKCTYSEEIIIKGQHNYKITEMVLATCTKDGHIIYTCTNCKDEYKEILTTSHNYVETSRVEAQAGKEGSITYTCTNCGDSFKISIPSIDPINSTKSILLIQDTLPWSEDVNRDLLNKLKKEDTIAYYNIITTKDLETVDLTKYAVVFIANDQTTSMYNRLEKFKEKLANYANIGGILVYGVCDNGWGGCGEFTSSLPGGVTTNNYYSVHNYILNDNHPIVSGVYTDNKELTNELLKGNYCSHTYFNSSSLVDNTNIILMDGNANPTLIEYTYGEGTVIATGLTWEYFYIRNHYNMSTNYSKYAYDDLLTYAIKISQIKSCEHKMTTKVVNPTCEEQGYTLHTCKECGYIYKDTYVKALGHKETNWIIVEEPTCTKEGIKELKCTECGEIKQETINKLEHNYVDGICTVCNTKDPDYKEEHVHTESDWIIVEESTCTKEGKKQKECTSCKAVISVETIEKTNHTIVIDKAVESTCKETGLTEGSHCSVCKEIIEKQEVIDKLEHNYVDGICTVCNTKDPNYVVEKASEGLSFELNDSKKGYIVTGIGTCTDTEIIIPNTYNDLPVTSIGNEAFEECTSLKSIVIPNSVTSIGSFAFYKCTSLTNIEIPNSVTSIGELAFYDCFSLTSITIPNSVSSIDNAAFYYCTGLKSIEIPNSVTSIGDSAFYYCISLESITIPSSVTSIGDYAFYRCTSLTSIIIPSSVTSIWQYAFSGCTSLESITIPNSVTSIGNAAFASCTSLTSITIPNSVTSIGDYAFYRCTSLTSIEIPNSVTSIGDEAFARCTSLTSIEIPSSVTSIGDLAFDGCTSLTNITVDDNNSVYDSRNNCNAIIETSTNTLIVGCKNTIIPNSVTSIGEHAFFYCTSLTSITIPNSVTSIGNEAFCNCTGLKSIEIPNSVTSIGNYAFEYCTSLTSIEIPNSVTSIGAGAFYNCTSLTSIEIPNSVTSIGYAAFEYCTSLTSITIPNSVTSIGEHAFYYCTSLTTIEIPNSVTSIGRCAFEYCTSLESIIIPNSVTSIGESAFYFCLSLTIYCEAESQPSGWDSFWNMGGRPVVWGYKND